MHSQRVTLAGLSKSAKKRLKKKLKGASSASDGGDGTESVEGGSETAEAERADPAPACTEERYWFPPPLEERRAAKRAQAESIVNSDSSALERIQFKVRNVAAALGSELCRLLTWAMPAGCASTLPMTFRRGSTALLKWRAPLGTALIGVDSDWCRVGASHRPVVAGVHGVGACHRRLPV